MKSQEIYNKYINYFKTKGHIQIPNASLIPENDPTLLFVNSGMFPLVPFLMGETHPQGKRLVNIQRSLRLDDIENVGETNRHTTVFHMLGNWSLGDYFKHEQLTWIYDFYINVLDLDPNRLYATVFAGEESIPKDTEAITILENIFKSYGVNPEGHIFPCGKKDNWWQRGDAIGELGGPDSETFYYIGKEGTGLGQDPTANDIDFLEIGNSVFMQYVKTDRGWEELAQKNIDFGGGLERWALVTQDKQDIFQTDNFWPIIEKLQKLSGKVYEEDKKNFRKIADHIRSATLLAMDGVEPSNKDQGYILRRLLRKMIRIGKKMGINQDLSIQLVDTVTEMLAWLYPQLPQQANSIKELFAQEETKFRKMLETGSKQVEKLLPKLTQPSEEELAEEAFRLYQSSGYPEELFLEDIVDVGFIVDKKQFFAKFKEEITKHQELSRKGAEQKFAGGLADQSELSKKYHTATHLVHWALRQVLGEHVTQQGSNITGERLRFDFSHNEKLTDEELLNVENLVNDLIAKQLPVKYKVLPKEEAEKSGALQLFTEKYGESVKVYYVGTSLEKAVSKEFCGGPHVENTSELSPVEIYKQEKIGKSTVRIYARFRT